MLAMQANDENRDTSLPRDLSDKDLPPPPPLRKSRKHRPTPLDLSPTRQHLSPLDSNNPNAIEDYLFSSSPISANTTVGLGMPSPVHYSQTDLLNILESNPPLTPVPPLRTSPPAIESEAPDVPQLSPGLPPASHCDRQVDDIFVELLQTENSFLEEVNTIEVIVREILAPLGVADARWLHAVEDLKDLHGTFVHGLIGEKMSGITPTVLKVLLKWPETARPPYGSYISTFRLGLDASFSSLARDGDIDRLTEIISQIAPEGSDHITLDYLFKRPLVRLRYYSKLYKYWTHFPPQIIDGDAVSPSDQSVRNELAAGHDLFKALVSTARGQVSEEKVRLQTATMFENPEITIESKEAALPTLSSLLNGVDCSTCQEVTIGQSKPFSLTEFINSNPGELVFQREIFLLISQERTTAKRRQLSKVVILPKHLILLGLTPSTSSKSLLFPPVFGATLNIFNTHTSVEIILGGGANVVFDSDPNLEQALRDLRQRAINDEGGRSPRPELISSPLIGGMRRSPAMAGISKSPSNPVASPQMGWAFTDQVSDTKVQLSRGWSFETRPRAKTEPPSRDAPQVAERDNRRHQREDSVSAVRDALSATSSASPTPSPPSTTSNESEIYRAPPPKMANLRRNPSPVRKPLKAEFMRQDTLSPNNLSPSLSQLPRSPAFTYNSIPKSPSLPQEGFPRLPQISDLLIQQLPSRPRSPQPRSLSPSRSVPAQLTDLPHIPSTPTKQDNGTPPMLPVLEFSQSPLGMRSFLNRNSASPRKPTSIDASPLAKDRYGRLPQLSTQMNSLSPIPSHIPRSVSPAARDTERGRISPSPTVCTFPPRTERFEEPERLAETRSVDDLRRLSGVRQGVISRLDHRTNGSWGSGSGDDEELPSQPSPPSGRVLWSGRCVVYFWKRGGWHRPEINSDESVVVIESFDPIPRGRSKSPPKVVLRVIDPEPSKPNNILSQHDILSTASIRRDSACEVSIGCDVPGGKKEYYLFACHDQAEADALSHALNTGRYFVGGISEDQLRQATSLFARTTSFASSLATNSSVGSTISNLSLYDTPPLPPLPAGFSTIDDKLPVSIALKLEEKQLVRDHKVKVFLRQDAGIWKNLGNGKLSVFTTGPEVRVHVEQATKKDPNAILLDGKIFESGACERVGRTGVAVNLPSREGKISVYMLQSKNDKEAQIVYEAIRKGRIAVLA